LREENQGQILRNSFKASLKPCFRYSLGQRYPIWGPKMGQKSIILGSKS